MGINKYRHVFRCSKQCKTTITKSGQFWCPFVTNSLGTAAATNHKVDLILAMQVLQWDRPSRFDTNPLKVIKRKQVCQSWFDDNRMVQFLPIHCVFLTATDQQIASRPISPSLLCVFSFSDPAHVPSSLPSCPPFSFRISHPYSCISLSRLLRLLTIGLFDWHSQWHEYI